MQHKMVEVVPQSKAKSSDPGKDEIESELLVMMLFVVRLECAGRLAVSRIGREWWRAHGTKAAVVEESGERCMVEIN
jgi:hypothetical protein